MSNTVCFREFEERDIDFVYKCKNDEKLNSLIVGDWHPFTYEEAVNWVHGCMGEHVSYKFWAICTNDEEKRIVGWASISEIDYEKKSAYFHGIVIADPNYRDGFAWIETYLFVYGYAFDNLGLMQVFGKARTDHISSQTMRRVMFAKTIDVETQAQFRNGIYFNISTGVLDKTTYLKHKESGDYTFKSILSRIRKIKKDLEK